MRIEEFEQFRDGVVGVMAFYGKDVSTFALDVWWNALKGFDLSAIREAFNRHLMNPDSGQFPPKPADIVRMLGGGTQDKALRAWAKVDKAIRQVGTYSSVAFDDKLIHRVLHEMGGWIGLGTKHEDEWPFVAKEFENRYRGYAMRGENPEYPPVLIGLAEANNRKEGFEAPLPVLIGNAERAQLVMLGGSNEQIIGFRQATEEVMAGVMALSNKEKAE